MPEQETPQSMWIKGGSCQVGERFYAITIDGYVCELVCERIVYNTVLGCHYLLSGDSIYGSRECYAERERAVADAKQNLDYEAGYHRREMERIEAAMEKLGGRP